MRVSQVKEIINTAMEVLSVKLCEVQAKCDKAFYEHSCDWQQLHKQEMYLRGKVDTLKSLKDILK